MYPGKWFLPPRLGVRVCDWYGGDHDFWEIWLALLTEPELELVQRPPVDQVGVTLGKRQNASDAGVRSRQ